MKPQMKKLVRESLEQYRGFTPEQKITSKANIQALLIRDRPRSRQPSPLYRAGEILYRIIENDNP